VVIVLAIGPKVHGFKPGRGRWILEAIQIRSTTSFGGEIKLSAICRKILRHVKNPCESMTRDTSSAIFNYISRQIPDSLLDAFTASREFWRKNEK
jgi:hypothetical protein